MIQFIDIEENVGTTYNGDVVLDTHGEPSLKDSYIFWLPEGQSTGLFYVKPICFASNSNTVSIYIEENDVFSIIDANKIDQNININDVKYVDLQSINITDSYNTPYILQGEREGDNYLYMCYILCHSDSPGEYICKFYIDGNIYLVGADFYDSNEILYINASNQGVELPTQITSAIYGGNLREELSDNILLNRKLKELLSNSWDIIANKGSYKSLINSLKWFEYGDIVKLKEIWKHEDFAKTIYDTKDINSIMSDSYENYMRQFSKTTNYALYLFKHKYSGEYDDEKNPILEDIVMKWSLHDMILKMSLLGAFYETYFMPIHLNLIQSTIVDTVFMNNIKIHYGAVISRRDNINNIYTCDCNIQDGDIYYISDVNVQVGPDTIFGLPSGSDYDNTRILGVDMVVKNIHTNDDAKQFYSQLFNSRACVVPVHITINDDVIISKEILSTNYLDVNDTEKWIYKEDHRLISGSEGVTHIDFNLLYKTPGVHELHMQFTDVTGRNYIKNVKFNILSQDNLDISLYRVMKKTDNSVIDNNWNYMFSNLHIPSTNNGEIQRQYIPCVNNKYLNINDDGISRVNHVFVIKDSKSTDGFDDMYNVYMRPYDDTLNYYIYISKQWNIDVNNTEGSEKDIYNTLLSNNKIIKSQYEYVPFYYELQPFGVGDNVDDYIIHDSEMMCFVPEIKYSKLQITPSMSEWEIVNASNRNIKYIVNGSMGPISAATSKINIPKGYYDIIYRFKSDDFSPIREIIRRSAFIKQ